MPTADGQVPTAGRQVDEAAREGCQGDRATDATATGAIRYAPCALLGQHHTVGARQERSGPGSVPLLRQHLYPTPARQSGGVGW